MLLVDEFAYITERELAGALTPYDLAQVGHEEVVRKLLYTTCKDKSNVLSNTLYE